MVFVDVTPTRKCISKLIEAVKLHCSASDSYNWSYFVLQLLQ